MFCFYSLDSEPLDEYILDYQTLTLDKLHHEHERFKRSTDSSLKIDFHAYNRY